MASAPLPQAAGNRSRTWVVGGFVVGATVLFAVAELLLGGESTVLRLFAVTVGALASLALARGPEAARAVSALPVGLGLLTDVVFSAPSFDAMVLGLGAGAVTLLWVGVPFVLDARVPGADVARAFVLPLVGGVAALVAAAVPLIDLFHPAALVIPVFAGLGLLIVLLAELSLRPSPTEAEETATAR